IPPGGEAYDPDLKTMAPYDPDAARRLLRDGGWTPGTSLSLAFNAGWGFMSELAHAIKSDLAKVDVVVHLAPQASWTEVVTTARQGPSELFLYGWLTLLSDAEVWLSPLFQSDAIDNLTRYRNPRSEERRVGKGSTCAR